MVIIQELISDFVNLDPRLEKNQPLDIVYAADISTDHCANLQIRVAVAKTSDPHVFTMFIFTTASTCPELVINGFSNTGTRGILDMIVQTLKGLNVDDPLKDNDITFSHN